MVNAATVGLITALHGTNDGAPTDLSGIVNVINKKADKSYVDTELDKKADTSDVDTKLSEKTDVNIFTQLKEKVDAISTQQNILTGSVSGSEITTADAVASPLLGLRVCGKSTQDGTPLPTAPVPIVSAGDGGTVVVTVSDGANESQTLTLQTPNALPGIPVTSGGNYTDENGQQWVCDEVDLARGVRVQRITKIKLESSMNWTRAGNNVDRYFTYFDGTSATNVLCTHFSTSVGPEVVGGAMTNLNYLIGFAYAEKGTTTVSDFKAFLDANEVYVWTSLATPVETALSAAEIAAYKALTTYAPTTVISVSGGAGAMVTYQRDANIIVEKLKEDINSTDKTLTIAGAAADAKATGDAVQEIADSVFGTLKETEIDALTLISSTKTENGYIASGRINNGIYAADHNNTLYCFFLNNGGKFKAENLSSDSYENPTRCWCAFSGVNGTTDELLAEYSDKVQTPKRTGVSTGGYIAFPDDVKMVVFAHANSDKSTISIKKLENQRDGGIKTSVDNALNDIAQLKVDVKSNASAFGGRLLNENTYKTGIAEASVASTTSSITDGVIVPALKNDVANAEISEIFRYSVPMKIAGDTFPKYKAVTSGLPINLGYRIEFYFSGKEFEVMIHGSSALTVCVDEYSITRNCVKMPSDGNVYYQKVTFPSKTEHKHISIYIDGIFRGIKTNGVIEKYDANRLKIIADGDSITESTSIIGGGEAVINSWIAKLAKVFNYDLFDVAFGGTGYLNNGTGRINMVDRFEDNVAKYNPDILISMGGLNDSYSDLSALATAVNSYWDKVSKLGCKAICVTPFNPQPTVMQISDAFLPILQKTCAKYGIPLIDTSRGITYDSTGSIITDNTNGYIKGIINSDNHDAFIGSDNTHLTLIGHEYFAKRMESEVYKLIRIDKYFN